jgi:integrase
MKHRASRTAVVSDALWVTVRGNKLNTTTSRELFKRTLKKIGLPDKQQYDLRRGCATNIIHDPRYGVTVAQKQLGHKDIRMTMRYENLGKREAARLFKGH